ncbi:MAG: DUF86 domain-containing protein [Armatimonadetes bacterium]|nr:DUF86 domain-containing protein [Armatimonadota bacterium]
MRRDDSYLLDMLVGARTVARYTAGVTWEEFEQNAILQDAVVRQVPIIGEAARALSPECRAAHPEIPWSDIIAMRHRLVHHYFAIRAPLAWDVVEQDIPALIEQLTPLVPPEEPAPTPEETL